MNARLSRAVISHDKTCSCKKSQFQLLFQSHPTTFRESGKRLFFLMTTLPVLAPQQISSHQNLLPQILNAETSKHRICPDKTHQFRRHSILVESSIFTQVQESAGKLHAASHLPRCYSILQTRFHFVRSSF